jgi:hypothetical protein
MECFALLVNARFDKLVLRMSVFLALPISIAVALSVGHCGVVNYGDYLE